MFALLVSNDAELVQLRKKICYVEKWSFRLINAGKFVQIIIGVQDCA